MAGVTGTETLGYLVLLCTVLSPSIVDCSGAKVFVWEFYGVFSLFLDPPPPPCPCLCFLVVFFSFFPLLPPCLSGGWSPLWPCLFVLSFFFFFPPFGPVSVVVLPALQPSLLGFLPSLQPSLLAGVFFPFGLVSLCVWGPPLCPCFSVFGGRGMCVCLLFGVPPPPSSA